MRCPCDSSTSIVAPPVPDCATSIPSPNATVVGLEAAVAVVAAAAPAVVPGTAGGRHTLIKRQRSFVVVTARREERNPQDPTGGGQ